MISTVLMGASLLLYASFCVFTIYAMLREESLFHEKPNYVLVYSGLGAAHIALFGLAVWVG